VERSGLRQVMGGRVGVLRQSAARRGAAGLVSMLGRLCLGQATSFESLCDEKEIGLQEADSGAPIAAAEYPDFRLDVHRWGLLPHEQVMDAGQCPRADGLARESRCPPGEHPVKWVTAVQAWK
jgi:hypothetical protein